MRTPRPAVLATGTLAILLPVLAPGITAQTDPAAAAPGTIANAIDWHLPGDFPEALERARSESRLLVVKGISFGIDEVGAVCATKGRW